jgi:hypothetical protein
MMIIVLIYFPFKNKSLLAVEKRPGFGNILIRLEKENMDMSDVYAKHVTGRDP